MPEEKSEVRLFLRSRFVTMPFCSKGWTSASLGVNQTFRCDRTVPCEHCSHSRTDICTYLMDEDQNNESTNNNSSENSSQQLKKSSGITKNIEFNGTVAAERTATSSPRNTAQTSYFSLPTPRPEFSTGYIRKQDPATTSYETQLPTPLTAPGLRVGRAGLRQCDSVDNTSGSGSGSSQTYEERSSTIQGIFSKSRYFGQSHWMNSLYQVRSVSISLYRWV